MQTDALKYEQAKLLYAGLPIALTVNVLLALILAAVLRSVIAPAILSGWLALLGMIILSRGILLAAWHRSGSDSANYDPRWTRRFRIHAIATGMAWGIGAVLLFATGDTPHQAFLAFVLAGLCAGAITTLAVDRLSALGFLVPALLPLIVQFYAENNEIALAMGVMSMLFLLFLSMSAMRMGYSLQENMRLRLGAAEREQILRQSEDRLNQAQEVAQLGSFDWNPVSGELQWSDEHFRLWGLAPRSITPDYAIFRKAVHPDDIAQLEETLQRALHGGRSYDCVHRIILPDGTEHFIHGRGEVMFDDGGTAVRMIGTAQNITGQKQVEDALRAATHAAESASRAKSEFLASMSHELRTPLNAVIGYSQLLDMYPDSPQDTREQAQSILNAGKHLLSLVNDLIDLSSIEADKMIISAVPVSVRKTVEDSIELVAPIAQQRGIKINQENHVSETAMVQADYNRLCQVVVNLLSNAIKYNQQQGSITISCQTCDDTVRISVTDTGRGIPADKQARIFNAFDRLGEERGTIEGTGIGLVITKRIVEAMGGSIGFESIENQGSTFWVKFPASKTAAPPREEKVTPASTHSSPQSTRPVVLYIEDNAQNLRLMEQIFGRRKDLELRYAHTAEFGIELARTEPPALIMMDINLPGMDGYTALNKLRSDPKTASIPVIAITANAMKDDKAHGLAAGFAAYITKPINIASLYDALGKLIAKSAA